MSLANKKAVLLLAEGRRVHGYLPGRDFLHASAIAVLLPDGREQTLPFETVRAIFFVRDFNLDDPANPERLGRRQFPARPRAEGLWLRLAFHDLAPLEGLAAFDLPTLHDIAATGGLFLTPPDPRSNTTRLFLPHHSIRELEVLGWIGSAHKRTAIAEARRTQLESQAGLFDDPRD